MSVDRKYIVSFEVQPYCNNFPYNEIWKLKKNDNIAKIIELWAMSFYIECLKRNEDELIKELKSDQILYSDDWENYWRPLL